MDLSKGELLVMEILWEGKCLDINGEIQALELSKHLYDKYGLRKTSCYTFLNRLLEKGAIQRRYPKYTLKPIISREEALKDKRDEAIETLFHGSIINVCQTFLSERKVSKEELQEMKTLIESFDIERK